MIIKRVCSKIVKDSRGEKTIEVSVNGCKASSPSGKSTGKYETKPYFRSLKWCVDFLNKWKYELEIESFDDLKKVENLICSKLGLKKAHYFGGNSLFAFESAILKALAKSEGKELWRVINPKVKKFPVPVGNVVGGGLHSNNKNKPEFQEFLIIPKGASFKENLKIMQEIYKKTRKEIRARNKNDEGAWETSLSNEGVFEILGDFKNVKIGVDVAASSFYKKGIYSYKNKKFNKKEQISYINSLVSRFDIFYLEDPLTEEDFKGFSKIRKKHLVVGDDLTVTHLSRLKDAWKTKSVNAVIVKPNQNGSLLDVKEIMGFCKKQGIRTIMSHRSGETLDNALADYAFGFGADFIKCGVSTKWRESKLNRLLYIEKDLRR